MPHREGMRGQWPNDQGKQQLSTLPSPPRCLSMKIRLPKTMRPLPCNRWFVFAVWSIPGRRWLILSVSLVGISYVYETHDNTLGSRFGKETV